MIILRNIHSGEAHYLGIGTTVLGGNYDCDIVIPSQGHSVPFAKIGLSMNAGMIGDAHFKMFVESLDASSDIAINQQRIKKRDSLFVGDLLLVGSDSFLVDSSEGELTLTEQAS